jgi:GNAT superfamily N-acetyltransferase
MAYRVEKGNVIADKRQIIDFWNRNHERRLDEKYCWIYENNPHGTADAWLLREEGQTDLLGMMVAFPRRLIVHGEIRVAGVNGDFFVDSKHRTLGPAVKLVKTLMREVFAQGYELLYTFPNAKSNSVLKLAGFRKLGNMVRLALPRNVHDEFERRGISGWKLALATRVTNTVLRCVSPETWFLNTGRLQGKLESRLGSAYNVLWNRKRDAVTATVDKDAEYMNWKYGADPDDRNETFCVYDRSGAAMLGCVVYVAVGNSIEIRELITANERLNCPVLYLLLRYLRRSGPKNLVVVLLEGSSLENELRDVGFIERHTGRDVYVLFPEEAANLSPLPQRPVDWMLMNSDEDT